MKSSENELLVKKLYETYPYPNRGIGKKEKLLNYVKWVSKIFYKDESYWKDKNILELGCGTGELANALSHCGANVTAIDFSSSSILKAKELAKKMKIKNVKFYEKNLLKLNLEKEFDVVIALGSLHHTIDARGGFSIACNHCKPDGVVIIGLYNKYSRFRHRLKRIILFLLAGKDFEKRMVLGKKLFGGNNSKSWLADKYGQVHESYHSINEILKWFNEEEINFLASKPKFKTPIIDELKWLFRKQNAFFVMIGTKRIKK
jgi:2-polyprenyl-3-methyl-5-hydroxy-6-metoxy-1,4-benzoquinol methylase